MRLIFVYNADAGLIAGMLDSIHKLVSPATYACNLCAITHGALRMDPRWKAWLARQQFETSFYHRPDFRTAFPAFAETPLPAILIKCGGTVETLLSANDLAELANVDALTAAIEARIIPVSAPAIPAPPASSLPSRGGSSVRVRS